jgi:prolipoprotein diacylglyceryltransferase
VKGEQQLYMQWLLNLDVAIAFPCFILLDVACVALGVGVPVFSVLFGFPVGWYIAEKTLHDRTRNVFTRILYRSFMTSAITFLIMAVVWKDMIPLIHNPGTDYRNFGHPLFLYDPRLSFIGWVILMIVVSPFLQMLTTVFASFITLASRAKPRLAGEGE